MPLTPDEQAEFEERFQALEDRNAKLERLIRSGRVFTNNPLALATDLDDLGSVKTHLDFEEPPLTPTVPPAGVSRLYAPEGGGFMATLLDTVTLTATAQTLANFTSIPAGFRNLRLVFQGQPHVNTDTLRYIRVQFNADTGNNYDHQESRDGVETQALITLGMAVGIINGALLAFPTHGEVNIPNYLGTDFNKQCATLGGFMIVGGIVRWESTGQWRNMAAITSVKILSEHSGSQFLSGSTASLYGY